jgi:sodium/potassium-transporting ATPase subunit alpha
MRIQSLTVAESLAGLRTTVDGLGQEEAARRLAEFGPNRLEEVGHERLLVHFFAVILWLAAALALVA